jgi:hypothetical protein
MGRYCSQRAGKCDDAGGRTRLHHPSTHTRFGRSSSCLWCLTTFTRTILSANVLHAAWQRALRRFASFRLTPLLALQAMSEPRKGTGGSSLSGFLLLFLLLLCTCPSALLWAVACKFLCSQFRHRFCLRQSSCSSVCKGCPPLTASSLTLSPFD